MKTYEKKQQIIFDFIDEIFETASIKIEVYNRDFDLKYEDNEKIFSNDNKTKIILKEIENKTYFILNYDGDLFTCSLSGINEDVIKQVNLICSIFNNNAVKIENISIDDIYKSMLYADLDSSQIARYSEKFSFPENPCLALLVTIANGKIEEVKSVLINYIEKQDKIINVASDKLALIKFVDSREEEFRSINEYASLLARTIYEETGIKASVYIGSVVKWLYDINTSYLQATNTLAICTKLNQEGNVHNYKEYVFFKMLEDLPKYKINEYLNSLLDYSSLKFFEDGEMVETAQYFLENSLNISETSRKLYLHRNTLSYRLDKIERETGLDIRKFSDALTFRLIILLKELQK